MQKEIWHGGTQGEESVTSFFSNLQAAWDELEMPKDPPCPCPPYTCTKKEDRDTLVSFIMGLNKSHANIRGQIIRMKPRPTVDMAYSIVMMEEHQSGNSTTKNEGTTLLAHQSKRKEYTTKDKKTFKDKEWKTEKNCENCKKIGHTIEDYFYTKGFPASHPLCGVFPRPNSEKFKKNQEKKGSKS